MDLAAKLEAILFLAGEPVEPAALARTLGETEREVTSAVDELARRHSLVASGLRILRSPEGIQLVSAPEAADAVEAFVTQGMREKLMPAAAETLAIVAYRGPISRAGIEAIRGVNSAFSIRLLTLRGLMTREPHPSRRSFVYQISAALLQKLGVTRMEDFPDYAVLHQHAGMTKLVSGADSHEAPVAQ